MPSKLICLKSAQLTYLQHHVVHLMWRSNNCLLGPSSICDPSVMPLHYKYKQQIQNLSEKGTRETDDGGGNVSKQPWWWLKSPGVDGRVCSDLGFFLFGSFLGKENGMDVWQDSTRGYGDLAQQLAEFFIIANSELYVTRDNSGLLVVSGCVTC